MKKWVLSTAVMFMGLASVSAHAAEKQPVDYVFLAECAAVYFAKAGDPDTKLPPDYIESYYEAAATFYKIALAGGGNDMKAIYTNKLAEFQNAAPNDAVAKQYKRALEKQCFAVAPEHGIKLR